MNPLFAQLKAAMSSLSGAVQDRAQALGLDGRSADTLGLDGRSNERLFGGDSKPTKSTIREAASTFQPPQAQKCLLNPPMTHEMISAFLDQTCDASPFNKYVGNERSVERLGSLAYSALERRDHRCPLAIAMEGWSSSGKTFLTKILATEVLGLPMVELQAATFGKSKTPGNDLLLAIMQKLNEIDGLWKARGGGGHPSLPFGLNLVPLGSNTFCPPPMVIFIDEAHALPNALQQMLLTAVEPKDRKLVTESGDTILCHNILWIIATTEIGTMFPPLANRFTRIKLKLYTREELVRILSLTYPAWDKKVLARIAFYSHTLPRTALAFADEVVRTAKRYRDLELIQVVDKVARQNGYDEYGMHEQKLNVLAALGQGPQAKGRLRHVAQCQVEELENNVMPGLLSNTSDHPALVMVTSRGFSITPAGLKELDKRGIEHRGNAALPKDMRGGYEKDAA